MAIESVEKNCLDMAMWTLRDVDDSVVLFVRDLGKTERELPAQFDVRSEGWQEMERRIDDLCANAQLNELTEACTEYRQRAARYLNTWRQKLGIEVTQ